MTKKEGHTTKDQLDVIFATIYTNYDPKNDSIIIAGDYNTDLYVNYKENGFYNLYNDFPNSNKRTAWDGKQIDSICVSDAFRKRYKLLLLEILPIGLSDHFPLIFDFIPL